MAQNYVDGLVQLTDKLREATKSENIAITLGEEGLFVSGLKPSGIVNDRLPALQTAAIDPAGAGDAFLVTTAMGLAAGGSIWESSYLGSLAAAVQVSRVGNVPLSLGELAEVLAQ
jgi:sugar/nucleoside kinase (ribokinase family)